MLSNKMLRVFIRGSVLSTDPCLAASPRLCDERSATRWVHDYHLFFLGAFSFAAATYGRAARRRRWRSWPKQHLVGMGVVHPATGRVLCRQREESAALERPTTNGVLAGPVRPGNDAHPIRDAAAPTYTRRATALVAGVSYRAPRADAALVRLWI